MTVVVGAVVGLLAGRLLWVGLRPTFTGHPGLLRDNHRGRPVPTAVGVVLAVAVVVVEAGRVLAGSAGIGDEGGPSAARLAVLVVALGLGLLGAIDDLVGDGDRQHGHRGPAHQLDGTGRQAAGGQRAQVAPEPTAVAVVAPPGSGTGRLLGDAALVALAANLANLLDRAPGRTGKAGLAAFAVLAVATGAPSALAAVAVVAGAAAALLLDDLRERLMLGDAGANVLGGALGLGAVVACAPATRTAALVVVAVLNVASEVVSFSRVIDAVPPLRALDRAGRRP